MDISKAGKRGAGELNHRGRVFLIIALLVFPAGSSADIYKCVTDNGAVKFSDQPCGKEHEVIGPSQSLDDLIALALPYRQPLADSNRITNDLLAHSKRIGTLMCPGLPLVRRGVHVKDEHRSEWDVNLEYADDGLPLWHIKFDYQKKTKIGGYEIWLKSITVFRWHKPFSPPPMERVTALKKVGPGEWVAP
jgi:hypothetical protein